MSEDRPAPGSGDRRSGRAARDPRAVEHAPATPLSRRVVHGPVTVDVADERAGPRTSGSGRSGSGSTEPLDLERWGRLAAVTAQDEGINGPAEMGLAFVDEAEIAELAGRWLRSPHPTDVLAFPLERAPERAGRARKDQGPPLLVGDVVVCPSVAARQAAEAGRETDDELALLVVHGVLHLLGHDHAGPIESRRMERRTRVLLARHHRT